MARKGTLAKEVQVLFHGRRTGATQYTWGGSIMLRGDTRFVRLTDHWLELIKRGDAEIIDNRLPQITSQTTEYAPLDESKLP